MSPDTDLTWIFRQLPQRFVFMQMMMGSSGFLIVLRVMLLTALYSFRILKEFTCALTHDHETARYHFGTRHSECNVHLERYLLKNTEETGNLRSHSLSMFLKGLNHARRMLKKNGGICFTLEQLERFSFRQVDQFLDNWSICL